MSFKKRERFVMSYKRYLKRLRRNLVFAAGCTDRQCYEELVHDAVALGVRIPRSLRGMR